ncbi:MAG: 50S ribosomal protein L29 [Paludibacteraceae bacterium]|nr:50S ribosomal protein L29 [Paludibacteraceae bacterium]MBR4841257.1 50S ribosomal protein L29 [Paludibacteraceae bacterium]
MKSAEIKGLTTEDLQNKLADQVKDYDRMKLTHAVSPLANSSQLRLIRKDIARMKTELRLRELNK